MWIRNRIFQTRKPMLKKKSDVFHGEWSVPFSYCRFLKTDFMSASPLSWPTSLSCPWVRRSVKQRHLNKSDHGNHWTVVRKMTHHDTFDELLCFFQKITKYLSIDFGWYKSAKGKEEFFAVKVVPIFIRRQHRRLNIVTFEIWKIKTQASFYTWPLFHNS